MIAPISPSDLEAATQALIRARKTNLGVEVTMPVVYPNGQMVTVVVSAEAGDYLVHDAGFGAMCLTAAGARLSNQLERRLVELAQHYGCEFVSGRMSRFAKADQLALAIVMVANASRTVGDQATYIRHQNESEFRHTVTKVVREVVGHRLRVDEEYPGLSGRLYHIPNIVLDPAEKKPIAFVVPLATRNSVASHFAELWDLKQAHSSVLNESIYDDAVSFRPEDWRLLENVSELVSLTSVRDQFARHGWVMSANA